MKKNLSLITRLYLYLFGVNKYIKKGNIEVVKYYYSNYNKNPNNIVYHYNDTLNNLYYTPALLALSYEQFELAKFIIEKYNIDVNKITKYASFVYNNILNVNLLSMVIIRIKYCRESDKLKKYYEFFNYLLNKGANVNIKIKMDFGDKYNILHLAIYNNITEIVKYIIYNSLINIESKTYFGNTPLYLAVKNNRIEIVRLLLDNGADINIICNGRTLLYVAYENNYLAMIKYLESRGAKIS